MQNLTKQTVKILDASYKKANLAEVLDKNCGHLLSIQQNSMLKLWTKYKELLNGTLGDFQTDPVNLELKKDATLYHGQLHPIPHSQLKVFKQEVEQLCKLRV